MSSGTAGGTVSKQLTDCVLHIEEIASQLRILAEALQENLRTLDDFTKALEERTRDNIKLIQSTTQVRSTLQVFEHALETDPQQRWPRARSSSSPSSLTSDLSLSLPSSTSSRQESRPRTRL